jgi:low affinity Fe/Cu permease
MAPSKRSVPPLERVSVAVTRWTGTGGALACAAGVVVLWLVLGPVFHFSDTWQLVINTGTTIVTFLMVFLIQRTQNKDALAVSLKLNELIAAIQGASNRLIDVEGLSERDLDTLHRHFGELVELASGEQDVARSHSIEEAATRHARKLRPRRRTRAGARHRRALS